MADSSSTNFLWVNPSTSNAPANRSKRRRDVMQTVALRRKQQPKHRHPNSRQLPRFAPDLEQGAEAVEKASSIQFQNTDLDFVQSDEFPSEPSLTDLRVFTITYPSMLTKSNLNFLDLSLLASLEVGRYTGQRLLENPQNLSHFLGGKNWSYCRYVPFYYNDSALVRSATDCVLARVRCLLTPDDTKWESVALSSYSKALSSLQEAINSTSQIPTAEILCSTQILGLYELLNPARKEAWIKHAAGATSIIKLRGPDSYASEFEKSLFMSHVGPMITESILNNERCFLEQPRWTAVLRSVITNNPLIPERSAMVNELLIILISIPGLFRDITDAICQSHEPPLITEIGLVSRAQNIRSSLRNWYFSHIGPNNAPMNRSILCDGFYRILVLFYIASIYSNRLNTCIFFSGTPEIEEMEDECQKFANNIVSLCKGESYLNMQGSLLLAQKLPIAEATIQSGADWKQQLSYSNSRSQPFKMPKQTFRDWCNLFGRKTL